MQHVVFIDRKSQNFSNDDMSPLFSTLHYYLMVRSAETGGPTWYLLRRNIQQERKNVGPRTKHVMSIGGGGGW
jgi:hypothetical protein